MGKRLVGYVVVNDRLGQRRYSTGSTPYWTYEKKHAYRFNKFEEKNPDWYPLQWAKKHAGVMNGAEGYGWRPVRLVRVS